jgi:hypothetical protein
METPPMTRPMRSLMTRNFFSTSGIRSLRKAVSIGSLRSTYQVVVAEGSTITAGGIKPSAISRSTVFWASPLATHSFSSPPFPWSRYITG